MTGCNQLMFAELGICGTSFFSGEQVVIWISWPPRATPVSSPSALATVAPRQPRSHQCIAGGSCERTSSSSTVPRIEGTGTLNAIRCSKTCSGSVCITTGCITSSKGSSTSHRASVHSRTAHQGRAAGVSCGSLALCGARNCGALQVAWSWVWQRFQLVVWTAFLLSSRGSNKNVG